VPKDDPAGLAQHEKPRGRMSSNTVEGKKIETFLFFTYGVRGFAVKPSAKANASGFFCVQGGGDGEMFLLGLVFLRISYFCCFDL
jgi:hypothetical protein